MGAAEDVSFRIRVDGTEAAKITEVGTRAEAAGQQAAKSFDLFGRAANDVRPRIAAARQGIEVLAGSAAQLGAGFDGAAGQAARLASGLIGSFAMGGLVSVAILGTVAAITAISRALGESERKMTDLVAKAASLRAAAEIKTETAGLVPTAAAIAEATKADRDRLALLDAQIAMRARILAQGPYEVWTAKRLQDLERERAEIAKRVAAAMEVVRPVIEAEQRTRRETAATEAAIEASKKKQLDLDRQRAALAARAVGPRVSRVAIPTPVGEAVSLAAEDIDPGGAAADAMSLIERQARGAQSAIMSLAGAEETLITVQRALAEEVAQQADGFAGLTIALGGSKEMAAAASLVGSTLAGVLGQELSRAILSVGASSAVAEAQERNRLMVEDETLTAMEASSIAHQTVARDAKIAEEQRVAAVLAGLAQEATVRAIFEAASGFSRLAIGDIAGSTQHFTAAAIFGGIAGTAAGVGASYAGGANRAAERRDIERLNREAERGRGRGGLGGAGTASAQGSGMQQTVNVQFFGSLYATEEEVGRAIERALARAREVAA